MSSEPRTAEVEAEAPAAAGARADWRGPAVLAVAAAVILAIYFAPNIFITVRSGEAGVLWRRFLGGTELTRAYGEGTVVIFPWDKLYVYDLTLQHVRAQTQVYSSDGLALKVTVSGRFRVDPEALPRLHAEIGTAYIQKLVEPELLASVRAVFGRYCAEIVYSSSELALLPALQDNFVARLVRHGLVQVDLQLERVELPPEVQGAIQQKLASAEAVQRERLEKERRTIQAEGLAAFQAITGVPFTQWGAIEATSELARSPNSKIIVVGNDHKSLPVLLHADFDDARGGKAAGAAAAGAGAEAKATPGQPTGATAAAGQAGAAAGQAGAAAGAAGSATPATR